MSTNLNYAAGKGGVYGLHPYIQQTAVDAHTVCLVNFNAASGTDLTGNYTPTFHNSPSTVVNPKFPWMNGIAFNGSNQNMTLPTTLWSTMPTAWSIDLQFMVSGTLPAGTNPIFQENWGGNDAIYVQSLGGDTGALRVEAVMGGSSAVYGVASIPASYINNSSTQSWELSGLHTVTFTFDGTLLTIYMDGNSISRALPTGTFFGGGLDGAWAFAAYSNNTSNTPITFYLARFSNIARSYAEHVQVHNQLAVPTNTCRTRWTYVGRINDLYSTDYIANSANGFVQEPNILFVNGTYYLWAHVGLEVPFVGLWIGTNISSLTYYGNVLGQGTGGESLGTARPFVLYDGGTFYFYYNRTTNNSYEVPNGTGLYVATSTDGKIWGSNALALACPFSGNGQFNTNTCVIKIANNSYAMWLEVDAPNNVATQQGLYLYTSTSPTGTWTASGGRINSLSLNNGGIGYSGYSPMVLFMPDGRYHMWFISSLTSGTSDVFHYVNDNWNTDTWTPFEGDPLTPEMPRTWSYENQQTADPSICYDGANMIYAQASVNTSNYGPVTIYQAANTTPLQLVTPDYVPTDGAAGATIATGIGI